MATAATALQCLTCGVPHSRASSAFCTDKCALHFGHAVEEHAVPALHFDNHIKIGAASYISAALRSTAQLRSAFKKYAHVDGGYVLPKHAVYMIGARLRFIGPKRLTIGGVEEEEREEGDKKRTTQPPLSTAPSLTAAASSSSSSSVAPPSLPPTSLSMPSPEAAIFAAAAATTPAAQAATMRRAEEEARTLKEMRRQGLLRESFLDVLGVPSDILGGVDFYLRPDLRGVFRDDASYSEQWKYELETAPYLLDVDESGNLYTFRTVGDTCYITLTRSSSHGSVERERRFDEDKSGSPMSLLCGAPGTVYFLADNQLIICEWGRPLVRIKTPSARRAPLHMRLDKFGDYLYLSTTSGDDHSNIQVWKLRTSIARVPLATVAEGMPRDILLDTIKIDTEASTIEVSNSGDSKTHKWSSEWASAQISTFMLPLPPGLTRYMKLVAVTSDNLFVVFGQGQNVLFLRQDGEVVSRIRFREDFAFVTIESTDALLFWGVGDDNSVEIMRVSRNPLESAQRTSLRSFRYIPDKLLLAANGTIVIWTTYYLTVYAFKPV